MSKYLYLIFVLISISFLTFTRFSFKELYSLIRQKNLRAITLALDRLSYKYPKKVNGLLDELDEMLRMKNINMTSSEYILINIVLSILLSSFGYLLENPMLIIVIFFSVNILAYQTLKHSYYKEIWKINKDLNLTMSLITNSYMQKNNLLKAIKSNIYKLPESIKGVFMDFLVQVEMVNPDIKKGVFELRREFKNIYFKKWCDLIIHCLDDRDYIKVLPAVVKEMANERENQNKLNSIVNDVYKENLQLLIIAAITPLILKLVFPEMLVYLLDTAIGKIIISINYLVITLSIGSILTVYKPNSVKKELYE